MDIRTIINWVKGFFIEVKHETFVSPTKPVEPWPWPVVTGDFCPKKSCVKKPAKKKPIDKDKVIKGMKKPAAKKTVAKKTAAKRVTKAK